MTNFKSFFIAGYECADQINKFGQRVNLVRETAHDTRVLEDYKDLEELGIKTVREGICWSAVEKTPFIYDFSEVKNRIEAAERTGIEQIWDIVHFGFPDGLYPTHPDFVNRFVSVCEAFTKFYINSTKQPLMVIPINEISFLSWLSGEVAGTVPFVTKNGWETKYKLCQAAIEGIKVIKSICVDCKVILVEPLIKIFTDGIMDEEEIRRLNEFQFQAVDILMGRICPELGGQESLADFIGVNYYWEGQWIHKTGPLPWPEIEPKRAKLSDLLKTVYHRYGKPLLISETGHFGDKRIAWLKEIEKESWLAIIQGIDLRAICLYPIIDRPDWDFLENYCQCGVWDLDNEKRRIPDRSYIQAIGKSHQNFEYFIETHNHVSTHDNSKFRLNKNT